MGEVSKLEKGNAWLSFSGEDVEAEQLKAKVRVLCWVMTNPKNHEKKARHIKATWARRCNKLVFISSEEGEGAEDRHSIHANIMLQCLSGFAAFILCHHECFAFHNCF